MKIDLFYKLIVKWVFDFFIIFKICFLCVFVSERYENLVIFLIMLRYFEF